MNKSLEKHFKINHNIEACFQMHEIIKQSKRHKIIVLLFIKIFLTFLFLLAINYWYTKSRFTLIYFTDVQNLDYYLPLLCEHLGITKMMR